MDEVFAILIAVGALVVGLMGLGWAYGDFRRRPKAPSPSAGQTPKSTS